jgi:hypothetical protein
MQLLPVLDLKFRFYAKITHCVDFPDLKSSVEVNMCANQL